MFSGAALNLGLMIGLLLWKPHPDQMAVFFIAAALWGLADALWQTQVNGKTSDLKSLTGFQQARRAPPPLLQLVTLKIIIDRGVLNFSKPHSCNNVVRS